MRKLVVHVTAPKFLEFSKKRLCGYIKPRELELSLFFVYFIGY